MSEPLLKADFEFCDRGLMGDFTARIDLWFRQVVGKHELTYQRGKASAVDYSRMIQERALEYMSKEIFGPAHNKLRELEGAVYAGSYRGDVADCMKHIRDLHDMLQVGFSGRGPIGDFSDPHAKERELERKLAYAREQNLALKAQVLQMEAYIKYGEEGLG